MATLQKIRSKGPLLIIVIGLALFAFIAGDAWKIMQPHQAHDVGEVDGKTLSAQEYQALVEEYTDVIKFSNNLTALTDEQTNQIKDEVWRNFVNNSLIEAEAKKLGLTVTKAEIQSIIDAGVHPMLQSTPFRNPQTGTFDKDMLKKFLVDYAKMTSQNASSEYMDYYRSLYNFWSFVEKSLVQSRLAEKYQALVTQAAFSNPVEAEMAFDARTNQMDMLLTAIPYSSIPDSAIKVKTSEVKELYAKKKEQFKQNVETRDIKYIDIQVVASAEDKAALQTEVADYAGQLADTDADYTSFVRSAGSEYPYVDLYYTKEAFPADVIARIDSAAIGEVYGPYFNAGDNTLNVFKKISRTVAADSIEFRQIQVFREDQAQTRALADSIYTALRGGADFAALAQKHGQTGETNWISSANYENTQLDGDNLKFISALTSLNVNEISNTQIGVANVILQVVNRKAMKDKYKIAVIKRPVDFSKETYNKLYNDFSQFIAANPTIQKMTENAEEAGYRLLERNDMLSSEYGVAGIKGTKEALRWVFGAKPGQVSGLYEGGDNDRLLVVALSGVNPEGYRSLESLTPQLRAEVVKEKKAEQIIASMKALNATSIEQYKSMDHAVSDSVKHVTFAAPAYISVLRSSEPAVSAFASVAEPNQLSAPVKGNAGVMVMQVYNKEKMDETFSAETEQDNLANTHARMFSRYIGDLYQKAEVKDNRYLYF